MAPKDRPVIAVTRQVPDAVLARIEKDYDARLNQEDTLLGADDLARRADGASGLLVTPTDKLNAETIGKLPDSIKVLATYSVGYDHIDVKAAEARGLMVTNTPDVLTDATADIALLLMLGAARGAYWGERMVREDRWGQWKITEPLGVQMTGKRLGILGMGRIGRAVAKRARGFDMDIHYHQRKRLAADLEDGAAYHDTLHDFMAQCDFLSINCGLTDETRHMIDEKAIAAMPDGSILVNTARGDIVVDDAVIAALNAGKLAAAGLDVYSGEPKIDPRYRDLENVFLLPHLGSATLETRIAMGMRALDNLDAFFAGNTPGDAVTK